MANKVSDTTVRTGEIVATGIALATLIVGDQVTALHPLFGFLLFLYLIQDFRRPSSGCARIIASLAMSFAILLFTCYPIDLILALCSRATAWDEVLAIQCVLVGLFVWMVKPKCERRTPRSMLDAQSHLPQLRRRPRQLQGSTRHR